MLILSYSHQSSRNLVFEDEVSDDNNVEVDGCADETQQCLPEHLELQSGVITAYKLVQTQRSLRHTAQFPPLPPPEKQTSLTTLWS